MMADESRSVCDERAVQISECTARRCGYRNVDGLIGAAMILGDVNDVQIPADSLEFRHGKPGCRVVPCPESASIAAPVSVRWPNTPPSRLTSAPHALGAASGS